MTERLCVSGATLAVAWTVGSFVSGPVIRCLKMNIPRIMALIVTAYSIVLFGYLTAVFLSCSEAEWVGTITQQG